MNKERTEIALKDIEANTGQLDWLPKNPRQWGKADVDRTAASIQEDTDFLEDRPVLVVRNGEKFVAFAGNLRREGAKAAGLRTVPVVIYPSDTEEDRQAVKRRALKDNGSFGSWDWDNLANEWDDLPLADYGIPTWNTEPEPEPKQAAPAKTKTDSGKVDGTPTPADGFPLTVHCKNFIERLELSNRLTSEGYDCTDG